MKIVKVIYEDGSEKTPKIISPLVISEYRAEQWRYNRIHERQFRDFEKQILKDLDQETVETYAVDWFDLIDPDEVEKEEKDISEFTDTELMEEVRDRKLLGGDNSIISEQFITRFSKIIEKENQILLDNLLCEFERKLNI